MVPAQAVPIQGVPTQGAVLGAWRRRPGDDVPLVPLLPPRLLLPDLFVGLLLLQTVGERVAVAVAALGQNFSISVD